MTETMKILVLDDQIGMRKSLGILLRKEGFQTEEAENGEQDLTLASFFPGVLPALFAIWVPP